MADLALARRLASIFTDAGQRITQLFAGGTTRRVIQRRRAILALDQAIVDRLLSLRAASVGKTIVCDDHFVVRFSTDVTIEGQRIQMNEVGPNTVANGKIIKKVYLGLVEQEATSSYLLARQ